MNNQPIPLDVLWQILLRQGCIYRYATICKAVHIWIIDTKVRLLDSIDINWNFQRTMPLGILITHHAFMCSKSLQYKFVGERGCYTVSRLLHTETHFCKALDIEDSESAYILSHGLRPYEIMSHLMHLGTVQCLEYFRSNGYHDILRGRVLDTQLQWYWLTKCDSVQLIHWMNKHFNIPMQLVRKIIYNNERHCIDQLVRINVDDPARTLHWIPEVRYSVNMLMSISEWSIGFAVQDIADYACQYDHVDVLEWLYGLNLQWNMCSGWILSFSRKSMRARSWLRGIKRLARAGYHPGTFKYWYWSKDESRK